MYNATIENAYKRLADWLNVGTSSNIANVPLDLLNRGVRKIASERDWDILEVSQVLTVDDNNSVLLPDLDIIHAIYDGVDGQRPETFITNEGRENTGYKVTNTFVLSSGWTRSIRFYSATNGTIFIEYKRIVPPFTSDYANEYTMFPENLVLRAAQLEHILEAGLDANLAQSIQADYDKELKKTIMLYEDENVDMRNEIKDSEGQRIITENYELNGDISNTSSDRDDRDVLR